MDTAASAQPGDAPTAPSRASSGALLLPDGFSHRHFRAHLSGPPPANAGTTGSRNHTIRGGGALPTRNEQETVRGRVPMAKGRAVLFGPGSPAWPTRNTRGPGHG